MLLPELRSNGLAAVSRRLSHKHRLLLAASSDGPLVQQRHAIDCDPRARLPDCCSHVKVGSTLGPLFFSGPDDFAKIGTARSALRNQYKVYEEGVNRR